MTATVSSAMLERSIGSMFDSVWVSDNSMSVFRRSGFIKSQVAAKCTLSGNSRSASVVFGNKIPIMAPPLS